MQMGLNIVEILRLYLWLSRPMKDGDRLKAYQTQARSS